MRKSGVRIAVLLALIAAPVVLALAAQAIAARPGPPDVDEPAPVSATVEPRNVSPTTPPDATGTTPAPPPRATTRAPQAEVAPPKVNTVPAPAGDDDSDDDPGDDGGDDTGDDGDDD